MRNGLGILKLNEIKISADWKDDRINGIYHIESPKFYYVGDSDL